MSTRSLGRMGEESAALYLQQNGFTVLARNTYLGHPEIDIIAVNDTHLIFAEVKTRRMRPDVRSRYGRPADAVNAAKRQHLQDAVQLWLRENRGAYGNRIPHIDIIEVYIDPSSSEYRVLDIRHYRNAVNGS